MTPHEKLVVQKIGATGYKSNLMYITFTARLLKLGLLGDLINLFCSCGLAKYWAALGKILASTSMCIILAFLVMEFQHCSCKEPSKL
jgi:hypothetical protein